MSTELELAQAEARNWQLRANILDGELQGERATVDELRMQITHLMPQNSTSTALALILSERARQNQKWGEQNHQNGTGELYQPLAEWARHHTQTVAAKGEVTWKDILREEFYEALAEVGGSSLKTELSHIAAVALQWMECIERNEALHT